MTAFFASMASGAALIVETIAVLVIVYGAFEATAALVTTVVRKNDAFSAKRWVWLHFARWLLLGLEFALAADIIRTAVSPTWDELGQLGVIATIRTVLSFFLERDLRELRESEQTAAHVPVDEPAAFQPEA